VSAPVQVVIAFLGLLVSAQTRVSVAGHQVPVLALAALAVVLALAALVLWVARLLVRDGFRLSPHPRMIT